MESIRKFAWRFLHPVFPYVRDSLLSIGILRHSGRQEYVLGRLRGDRTPEEFAKHLTSLGFSNHAAAWVDDDELLGLRKLDGFRYQYHIRLHHDYEVRGHYEVTAEAGLWNHFLEWEMEPKRKEFLRMIGEWIIPHEAMAMQVLNQEAQSPTRARQHSVASLRMERGEGQ